MTTIKSMNKQDFINLLNREISKRTAIVNDCMTRKKEPLTTQVPAEKEIIEWLSRWDSVFIWSIGEYISQMEILSLLVKIKVAVETNDDLDIRAYLWNVKDILQNDVMNGAKRFNSSTSPTANFSHHQTMIGKVEFIEKYLSTPMGLFDLAMKAGFDEATK